LPTDFTKHLEHQTTNDNMSYTLYYDSLADQGTQRLDFDSYSEIAECLEEIFKRSDGKTVYLLSIGIDSAGKILVSHQPEQMRAGLVGETLLDDIFLFEYASYEKAYKVALEMRETLPFCYDDGESDEIDHLISG
jgi:hypothetical protein